MMLRTTTTVLTLAACLLLRALHATADFIVKSDLVFQTPETPSDLLPRM
jgi:hypothetical protein